MKTKQKNNGFLTRGINCVSNIIVSFSFHVLAGIDEVTIGQRSFVLSVDRVVAVGFVKAQSFAE